MSQNVGAGEANWGLGTRPCSSEGVRWGDRNTHTPIRPLHDDDDDDCRFISVGCS